jgi:hypothetical protein
MNTIDPTNKIIDKTEERHLAKKLLPELIHFLTAAITFPAQSHMYVCVVVMGCGTLHYVCQERGLRQKRCHQGSMFCY